MAPVATEETEIRAFAKEAAERGSSLVNAIQAFLEGLDQEVYEKSELVEEVLHYQETVDDAWRMLKGSIPD